MSRKYLRNTNLNKAMRDKRHALLLLLLLLWKWKCCCCCCCCSWYANTRQVGHLRRSAVKLCVCVWKCVWLTINCKFQAQGSSDFSFLSSAAACKGCLCARDGGRCCRGSTTWANSHFALINAQLWLLWAFIYIAKKGCLSLVSFLNSHVLSCWLS